MIEVGISIGANLGDRFFSIKLARDLLKMVAKNRKEILYSSVYQTAPVGSPIDAPDFFNAVVVFQYEQSPHDLLQYCQSIEAKLGRVPLMNRDGNAPRPIDVDILYMCQQVISEPDLIIPHPRMTHRRFVLEPLCELRPDLVLPSDFYTVQEHLDMLESDEPPLVLIEKEW